jgi:hypothetical protein
MSADHPASRQILSSDMLGSGTGPRGAELGRWRAERDATARAVAVDRAATAERTLDGFRDRLALQWLEGADLANAAWRAGVHDRLDHPPPRVMVGTLHSGEQEFERCVAAIRRQRHPAIEHVVIEGLPKAAAVAALM